jgi:entry exclusion lipoprotein TrbK
MHKRLLIAAVLVGLLAGCEKQPPASVMPEVNDANCQLPKILEIKDKATREAFAGKCAHRSPTGGGIAPTKKPKNWLELIDQTIPKGLEAKP